MKVIGGHLIGDDNAFAEPGWGSGWSWDDLVTDYGSPIGALQYNENEVELLIGPGIEAGTAGIISSSPLGSGLLVDNQVVTVAADQPTRLSIDRVPGTIMLNVRGQVARLGGPRAGASAVDNPTTLFLNAFREALSRKGIFVGGSALDIDELRTAARPDRRRDVGHRSVCRRSTRSSTRCSSGAATATPRRCCGRLSPPGAPASEAAGLQVLPETLTALGVDPALYAAFDGSGLSRYDMVSAGGARAAADRDLERPGDDRARPAAALPVPGVAGSLANQMKGTPAEGTRLGQDRLDVQHPLAVRLRAHRRRRAAGVLVPGQQLHGALGRRRGACSTGRWRGLRRSGGEKNHEGAKTKDAPIQTTSTVNVVQERSIPWSRPAGRPRARSRSSAS